MSKWIDTADELISTDFSAVVGKETDLCKILAAEGSDKGGGWHNYSVVYDLLFKDVRDAEFLLFELGMGTTNAAIKSNMGPTGRPGASLRAWTRYFTRATIYGADVDREIVGGPYDSDRITTSWVDQTDPDAIGSMWDEFPFEFEIIIDDGLHEAHGNITFLENSYTRLSPTGVYIIEDIMPGDVAELQAYLQRFCASHKFDYRLLDIPTPPPSQNMTAIDNRIAVLSRR